MLIRKRSFFEMLFPLTIVFYACIGTSFIDAIGAAELRWLCAIILFFYLFLNGKILPSTNYLWKAFFFTYLIWCVLTSLWSQSPPLSSSKSIMFAFNVIVMVSAGSLWVIKYGYDRSLHWLVFVLLVTMLSGLLGGATSGSYDGYGSFSLYAGLNGNANAFGFLVAIISPLIFLKIYQYRKNTWLLTVWLLILIIDLHFLIKSYSRSSTVIFMCVSSFFVLSLPLSKKIFVTFFSFFLIMILLIMTPLSYLESVIASHIIKYDGVVIPPDSNAIFQSRMFVWQKSLNKAEKGGIMGGGFGVNIDGSNNSLNAKFHREKGNSQLAIMEETGIIGLILYLIFIISFFMYVIPWYIRMKGHEKAVMGIVLGAIVGLIMESIVEAWWDSAAGPEMICFWTFVGMVYGMIYLQKRKSLDAGVR